MQGVARVAMIARSGIEAGLSPAAWAAAVVWSLANAYLEGYRGFQQKWVPRVVGRAFELAERAPGWQVALAPLVAMGLLAAPRRRLVASWVLVSGIVVLVLIARSLPPAPRAIIDVGVVVGLAWGVVALWWAFVQRLRSPM